MVYLEIGYLLTGLNTFMTIMGCIVLMSVFAKMMPTQPNLMVNRDPTMENQNSDGISKTRNMGNKKRYRNGSTNTHPLFEVI